MPRGLLITFEGIDGSGKSTQARLLADHLRAAGHEVVSTREPGGSDGAEQIRGLLLTGGSDRWSAMSEILLFTAARRDHLERTIAPALERGALVICDRFVDSTRVYQAAADPALRAVVDQLHALAIGMEPALTLVIDLDPALGLARATARAGAEMRFESRGLGWQTRLRQGFLRLAEDAPGRVRVIAGDRPPEAVAADVAAAAAAVIAAAADPAPRTAAPPAP